jgi:hypothetical protein
MINKIILKKQEHKYYMVPQNLNFLSLIFKKFNIPQDIITSHLWPLVSFPHQGRIEFNTQKKNTKIMNKCIKRLPKLNIFNGPKIIYNLNNPNMIPKIRFVYSIYHSTKYKHRYITVHETVNPKTPMSLTSQFEGTSWDNFTTKLRKIYYENINLSLRTGHIF